MPRPACVQIRAAAAATVRIGNKYSIGISEPESRQPPWLMSGARQSVPPPLKTIDGGEMHLKG